MSSSASVPIVVVSARPDDAEAISQAMRNAGHAAHCQWLPRAGDAGPVLLETGAELLYLFTSASLDEEVPPLARIRDRAAPEVPLIVVQSRCDEEAISTALALGAQDLVSPDNTVRLQAVSARELHHCQQTRQVHSMLAATQLLEKQVNSLVNDSADALMLVQEGIVVQVNPAWLTLFGHGSEDDIAGTPALDLFAESGHTVIKGAVSASMSGKWTGDAIDVKALAKSGEELDVLARFERAQYDDEPCVRVTVVIDSRKAASTPQDIVAHTERHPLTGFYRRQRFLQEMEKKLTDTSRGGVWVLAYVKPDAIANLREQIGPLSSDDLLLEFARILQDHARKNDVYGQFGGDLFMVLMPRGTARDALAWAESLRNSVAAHLFEFDDKSLSLTCTIGLARHSIETEDLASLILKAQKAYQDGVKLGGNRSVLPDLTDEEEGHRVGDTSYVQKIKQSLMQDSFRLVFQPVANLGGQSQQMFDVLIRMLDNNRELMPGAFLPAARRNNLMKNIDRWVIANALRFVADQQPAGLFIRLSADSITDTTLVAWTRSLIADTGINASSLIFQITEADAEERLRAVRELATGLKSLGCQVALEHFGVSQHPLQMLEHVPLDFIKIDGSLMEGITSDKVRQAQVHRYISAAKDKNIATVAERVEDANTMAVLWQLGVEYIQGFYVQGPEEIVLESA